MTESRDSTNGTSRHSIASTELVMETRRIGDSAIETVDARRLHAFLQVRKDFSTWLKERVSQYGFAENVDFVFLPKIGENSGRGQPARDYALSIDMAKELSMVERTARGKEARRYFIECERRAKATAQPVSSAARTEVSREYRLTMQQNVRWAKMAGLSGNQALLAANRATETLTGIDTLGLLGVTHLTAPQQEALMTPSDIGKQIGLSARSVNLMLCERGLQDAFRDAKGHIHYEPTEEGIAAGGVMQDTGKRHSTGVPVRQLRWGSSTVDRLREPSLV